MNLLFPFSSQDMCSIRSSRIGVDSRRNLILLGARATHSETISSILPFRSLMKLLLGAYPRLLSCQYCMEPTRTDRAFTYFATSLNGPTDCTSTFPTHRLSASPRGTSTRQTTQSRAPRNMRTYNSTSNLRHSPFGLLADPIPIRGPFSTHV